MSDQQGTRAEIGVLLVHGIGEQQRGDTLLRFGEPIVDWIGRWLDRIGMAWTLTDKDQRPEAYRDFRTGEIQITQSDLLPDTADVPPHVRFRMKTHAFRRESERQSEWLIVESRWAASFPPPNPRDVIQWTMKILPLVITSALVPSRRVRTSMDRLRARTQDWSAIARNFALAVPFAGLVLLAALLSPIVFGIDLLLLGLLLLTFIPIPAIQRYLDWVQFKLAAIVGDSYIFTESEVRKRAVVDRLLADLAWLEQRCESVTIVAHSQGAAVAYYALQEESATTSEHAGLTGRIRLLLTFGSGLAKLDALSENRRSSRDLSDSPYQVVAFIGAPLATIALLLLMFGGISPRYGGFIAFGVTAITFLLMGLMSVTGSSGSLSTSAFERWAVRLKELGIHWMDVYASNDPIPGGPIIVPRSHGIPVHRDESPLPESHQVHNRGSLLSDHTTYQSNVNEFIPLLVTSITRHSPCSVPLHDLTPKDAAALAAAATLRRYRVKFLQTRRWIVVASMISVLVSPHALSVIGGHLHRGLTGLRRLPPVELIVPSSSATVSLGVSDAAAGFVAGLLFHMLVLALFTWTWKLVDEKAVADLTWRRVPGDAFIGLPMMLPDTRRGEARFVDYLLRLLPWLAASIAVVINVPSLSAWTETWLPASSVAPLRLVLVLTLTLAGIDAIVSYRLRRRFLESFLPPPAPDDESTTPA